MSHTYKKSSLDSPMKEPLVQHDGLTVSSCQRLLLKCFSTVIQKCPFLMIHTLKQSCGAGANGAENIWDMEPEPKLNF